jgi:hypothetical protein
MFLLGVWYHHVFGQRGWKTSYRLLHGSFLAYAYFHLVFKSKFPMLHTAIRKGLPRFSMLVKVKKNLIATIEKMRKLCRTLCRVIIFCYLRWNCCKSQFI